jgi:FkbM family methyltransferase
MGRTEYPTFSNLIADPSIITKLDPVVDIARKLLPEPVKKRVRRGLRKEDLTYPLPEPVSINLNGIEAKFWIRNHSDYQRILNQNFEGQYAQRMIETIARSEGGIFADIGAAQGVYSIPAAKTGAKVYAFDPDPLSYESFTRNQEINPGTDIVYFNCALGNKTDTVRLQTDNRGIYAPSLIQTVPGLKDTAEISMYPFDLLVLEGFVPTPNVVKIDVEGAESLVLEGMEKTLSSNQKPNDIFIEIHPKYLKGFGKSAGQVVLFLKDLGYSDSIVWQRRSEYLCHFVATG